MLTRLDELHFPDHWYLTATDECYFSGEYTARRGYAFSRTNDLIYNFKKGLERRGLAEWRYKHQAVVTAAAILRESLNPEFLRVATFVPIPPSKAPTDPLYDDRVVQLIRNFGPDVDCRELIFQAASMEDAHTAIERPTPQQLYDNYRVRHELLEPIPTYIAIVDDVVTTGAHFIAMKKIITETLPGIQTLGLFIARRIPDDDPV